MIKKTFKLWSIVGLMIILALVAACGAQPAPDTGANTEADTSASNSSEDAGDATEKQLLRMSTLGPGSSPNLVMSTFATIVNETVPGIEISVNATGIATQHALEAGQGNLEFFMSSPIVHNLMTNNLAMYAEVEEAPELAKNLRNIFNFPLGTYHIIVNADSGIESLDDIRGKRVFLGPPGGAALRNATLMVNGATGMEPDTDFESVSLGWDAATQAFQDGQIDVWVNPTNAPSPAISQVALTRKIRLLGFDEEDLASEPIQNFLKQPIYSIEEIPPDVYGENQVNTEPVQTIRAIVGVGTHKGVDEETIYTVTKAFWEGVEARSDNAPWLSKISVDTAFDAANMPLHPGAIRYYEEIGVKISEDLKPTE